MLEETETLKFPLPAVIDIDLTYTSFKKSALERFFSMDGKRVRKICLTPGQNNMLNVLQNTTIVSVDELNIANDRWSKAWSREVNEDLCKVIMKMKPRLLSIELHLNSEQSGLGKELLLSILRTGYHLKVLKVNGWFVGIDGEVIDAVSKLSSNIELVTQGERITLIHKSTTIKCLSFRRCDIDTEIAEAVSRLPDHKQLDLSCNRIRDKSACITLINKAASMKCLNICNCGIQIDTEIAEAVSRLPDDIQLDLSNKLTKMDPRLLPGVLLHMSEDKEIDMTECGVTIDVNIVKALSKMPQINSLNASNNIFTPEAAQEFSMSHLQQLYLSKCDVSDKACVPLMISLSKHCPMVEILKLEGNNMISDEWCHHVQMKQLRELYLSSCGINDAVCVSLMTSLSKHCPLLGVLDLSRNILTSDVWCHHIQMKQLTELNLSRCGTCDTVCVSLMKNLSKHCPLLEVFYLGDKELSSSGVLEIMDHFKHMKNMRELWLNYKGPAIRRKGELYITQI